MNDQVRRYEVGSLVAKGGMAEIMAACAISEPGVAKRVALKKIRTDHCTNPLFVARFFDEARLAMQLSHTNIVQVFDFGRTEESEFFLAMEFVEGVDLQRLRRTAGCAQLPPPEALYVVAQMLRGLDYAHRRVDVSGQPLGIVHLDVKPANVLLSFEGEVKLTDFGVARSRDACRPIGGGISGTIPFMSPEQARGDPVDARSDIFSAGVVLHALLTGTCPFGESDSEKTLKQICQGKPAKDIDIAIIAPVVWKALDPSPEKRYPTAGIFADAIEELLYAQGWRGGNTALAGRIRQAFPGERERINALFSSRGDGEEWAVQHGFSDHTRASVLSRIREPELPQRQTLVAQHPQRGHRRRGLIALAGLAGAASVAVGAAVLHRHRAGHNKTANLSSANVAVNTNPRPVDSPPAAPPADSSPAVARENSLPTADGVKTTDPPAPKNERPAMGTLTINASPWGTVSVNGKPWGTTPLMRHPVLAGPAMVVVENPKLGRRVTHVKILPRRDTALIVDFRSTNREQ